MVFTKKELATFLYEQRRAFDIVRVVDVSMTRQYEISPDGELVPGQYECYAVWNKESRCENCISSKVFASKNRLTKFEFIDQDVYFVMALYAEIEWLPCVIEMVSKMTDETLFGAYGKNRFIRTIQDFNNKMYIDPLTGAYNRRYFEEQLRQLSGVNAMVMMDVDCFKSINDTYGHSAGDLILQSIVKIARSNMRSIDAVVRWGGDEFILLFQGITEKILEQKLETIREAVEGLRFDDQPQMKTSVSMGCIYASSAASCFEEADRALYEAKSKRNCCVIRSGWQA